VNAQPPTHTEPQHSREPWRLRGVQQAQPHLGEGDLSWVPMWTIFAVVIIIFVAVGTFLFVWLGAPQPTNNARSLPLAATSSLTAPAVGPDRFASKPTPTVTLFYISTATPTILPPTVTRTEPTTRPTAGIVRYRVLPGDTLTAISAKYHVSIRAIQQANRLQRETIYEGEELIIPHPTPIP
jgi:hypothetical protein